MITTKEEIIDIYEKLSIGHHLAVVMCDDDKEIYGKMMVVTVQKVIGDFGGSKMDDPNFDSDIFMQEVCKGLEECLENEELVEKWGELWLAKDGIISDIVDAISVAMLGQVIKVLDEERQAMYN